MYYDFPTRRKFRTVVSTKAGDCVLTYEQNSLQDTILMLQNMKDPGYLSQWLTGFINDNGDFKGDKEKILESIMTNPGHTFDMIWNKINKKHDSIYENVKRTEKGERGLFSTDMMLVCKKYNISGPLELAKNYTLEQFEWMIDGVMYSLYAKDKKTWRYNKQALSNKYNDKEENKKLMLLKRKGWTPEQRAEFLSQNSN